MPLFHIRRFSMPFVILIAVFFQLSANAYPWNQRGTDHNRHGREFQNPKVGGLPISVYPESISEFCRSQGFAQGEILEQLVYIGTLTIFRGGQWIANANGYITKRVFCGSRQDRGGDRNGRFKPIVGGYPISIYQDSINQFCREQRFVTGKLLVQGTTDGIVYLFRGGYWQQNQRGLTALEVQCLL